MEMIPLDENVAEKASEAGPPPEAALAGREPLVVESLENRVLLAADAAPAVSVVEPTTAEPAPFVAAPHTHHIDIDLQALAESAEAGDSSRSSAQVLPGGQSPHGEPRPPEAEKVEYDNDLAVEAVPENKELESDGGRDELGLATIEPPKSKAEAAAAQNERIALEEPIAPESQAANAKPDRLRQRRDDFAAAAQAGALSDAVIDVAAQLDPGLVKAVHVETQIEATPAGPTVSKASAGDDIAILAQAVIKTDAISPSTQAALPAATHEAAEANALPSGSVLDNSPAAVAGNDVGERQEAVEPPRAAEYNAQPLTEMPPAAHDALFAGGQGIEAVLERSSA